MPSRVRKMKIADRSVCNSSVQKIVSGIFGVWFLSRCHPGLGPGAISPFSFMFI